MRLVVAVISLLAAAPPSPLSVGDVAPPLTAQAWLERAQPAIVQPGKVIVVEFWATWCGPCLANIPHLTALQKKYAPRGVVVIGATSPDDWGNDRTAVEKLIAAKGPLFDYSVAWLPESRDGKYRGIHTNPWFRAAQIQSLPCAFVIDRQGRIAFIGDPAMLDDVIGRVVDGTWNQAAERTRYLTSRQAVGMIADLQKRIAAKDRANALRVATEITSGPGHDDPRSLLIVASALTESPWTDREMMDAALAAAQRAVDLTKAQAPGMLDQLARVWFLRGDIARAIDTESRAAQISEGPMQEAQKKNLAAYRQALKPRP